VAAAAVMTAKAAAAEPKSGSGMAAFAARVSISKHD
jgi:hypothetical protein